MRSLLLLVLLGGCPPPSQFLIAEVTSVGEPVADALVAAACGNPYRDAALRTGHDGRARLTFRTKVDARTCTITVARAGSPTIEAVNLSICTTPACPATHVELGEVAGVELPPPSELPLAVPRAYAEPPQRSMEVAR